MVVLVLKAFNGLNKNEIQWKKILQSTFCTSKVALQSLFVKKKPVPRKKLSL